MLVDPKVGRFKPANVHALTDGEVTTKQLKQELNWLARSASDPDDLVVVFLSSHGTPRNIDTAEVNYIATSDTEVMPEDNLFATALPMVQISDIIRSRIKAQPTVIFLDTCQAGQPHVAARPLCRPLGLGWGARQIRQGVARAIVTSSAPEGNLMKETRIPMATSPYFLMEAMKKNGGQGSIEQIYDDLR